MTAISITPTPTVAAAIAIEAGRAGMTPQRWVEQVVERMLALSGRLNDTTNAEYRL